MAKCESQTWRQIAIMDGNHGRIWVLWGWSLYNTGTFFYLKKKKKKITDTKLDVNIYLKKIITLQILKRKQTVQMWKSRTYNTISN